MLLLFETPAGYSVFKVNDQKKLAKTEADGIHDAFFSSYESASKMLSMVAFQPFADTADAVAAATACQEGTVNKTLQKFLNKKVFKSSVLKELIVADKGLAVTLKEAISDLKITHDNKTQELYRGLRCYMDELLNDTISASDLHKMQLGLSHSLSRYKLKFSADKVDTMIIQAVGLLDELDKEINTYAMRVKEWYGWHFPELQALVSDNVSYSKLVLNVGVRTSFQQHDLSDILEDETLIQTVKENAEISMGTDITELDILNIQSLADQVLSLTEYRSQLFEYLRNRMNSIAPNLTILVGELVGARLISHAGSLMNLAKQPASTIQILGAEKALFRALKSKSNTPKYGLIYHASLIGQAAPKHKGKISRVLAAKAALAIRVDALSDDMTPSSTTTNGDNDDSPMMDTTIGFEGRAKVEARLRQLETTGGGGGTGGTKFSSTVTSTKIAKYDPVAAKMNSTSSTPAGGRYNIANDVQLNVDDDNNKDETKDSSKKKDKKEKKRKNKEVEEEEDTAIITETPAKKQKTNGKDDDDNVDTSEKKSAKKDKSEKKAKKEKKHRKSSD